MMKVFANRKAHRDMELEQVLAIRKATNGWIVQKGCITLVFDTATLSSEIVRYLNNPDVVEKEYTARYYGKGLIGGRYGAELEATNAPSSSQVSEDSPRKR